MSNRDELMRGLSEALDRALKELREGIESDAESEEEAGKLWGAAGDFWLVNSKAREKREAMARALGEL